MPPQSVSNPNLNTTPVNNGRPMSGKASHQDISTSRNSNVKMNLVDGLFPTFIGSGVKLGWENESDFGSADAMKSMTTGFAGDQIQHQQRALTPNGTNRLGSSGGAQNSSSTKFRTLKKFPSGHLSTSASSNALAVDQKAVILPVSSHSPSGVGLKTLVELDNKRSLSSTAAFLQQKLLSNDSKPGKSK